MARGIGKAVHCDCCDKALTDYRGRMIDENEAICKSEIFGATGVVLCNRCFEFEQEEEQEKGTNKLPHLLKRYRENKY